MGYQHIDNLYKNQTILADAECYALEKIHGTSAHIKFTVDQFDHVHFFSGGEKHENFIKLFNASELWNLFVAWAAKIPNNPKEVTIYGEAYGGKCQKMSATYGPELRFIAFEACSDGQWLDIQDADLLAQSLGLDFVQYDRIPTTMTAIDAARDADSFQALRNGMGPGHRREGVVLFPIKQRLDHRGNRVCAKHKRDEFRETVSPRVVTEKSIEIVDAEKAAHEFVTEMRLEHVLDKLPGHDITQMGKVIIPAMVEDVLREGTGEVVDSPALRKEIARRTAILYKKRFRVDSSIFKTVSCGRPARTGRIERHRRKRVLPGHGSKWEGPVNYFIIGDILYRNLDQFPVARVKRPWRRANIFRLPAPGHPLNPYRK